MAKVKIEEIVDHLSSEMRRALEEALSTVMPNAAVDGHEFFRAFRRAVGRRCNTWETVPDSYVEKQSK
jgi:hypothetical protein